MPNSRAARSKFIENVIHYFSGPAEHARMKDALDTFMLRRTGIKGACICTSDGHVLLSYDANPFEDGLPTAICDPLMKYIVQTRLGGLLTSYHMGFSDPPPAQPLTRDAAQYFGSLEYMAVALGGAEVSDPDNIGRYATLIPIDRRACIFLVCVIWTATIFDARTIRVELDRAKEALRRAMDMQQLENESLRS